MTLRELIDDLEQMAEDYGDDTEVRLAQQPNWPFEYSLSRVEAVDLNEPEEDEDDEPGEGDEPTVVYLGEGQQLGYLPAAAARALGWK